MNYTMREKMLEDENKKLRDALHKIQSHLDVKTYDRIDWLIHETVTQTLKELGEK